MDLGLLSGAPATKATLRVSPPFGAVATGCVSPTVVALPLRLTINAFSFARTELSSDCMLDRMSERISVRPFSTPSKPFSTSSSLISGSRLETDHEGSLGSADEGAGVLIPGLRPRPPLPSSVGEPATSV